MQNIETFTRFICPPDLPGLEIRYGEGCALAYQLHTHDSYSLGLVLAGQTAYQCQNRHYPLRVGDALCLAPDTPHACNPQGGQWRYLMCQIDAALWPAQLSADGTPFHSAALNAALLALWHHAQSGRALASHWQRTLTALQRATSATHAAEEPWRQTLAALSDEPADIDAWAQAAHISRRQLARLLAPSGMSPHQWLICRRINRGKALLRAGRGIAETAHDTGFADQAHFQRQFKHHTAITPGQYRKHTSA